MRCFIRCFTVATVLFTLLTVPFLVGTLWAQGVTRFLSGGPSTVPGGLDLAPSDPLGLPGSSSTLSGESETLNISSRMFPDILSTIPGLEISYLHVFGTYDTWNRLSVEFVRPFRLDKDTTLYGEIHGILHEPFKGTWWSDERVDLSAGGGYRRRFGDGKMVGVHGFYDATRSHDSWFSSVSVGGFAMAMLPGDDAMDLTVNWYGGVNTGLFGVGPEAWEGGTFDGTVTYYHQLWNEGPDLQLSLVGYKVGDQFNPVYLREGGYAVRVQVASRDGMLRGFYMYEDDRRLKENHTVGVSLNVGFRLERLLAMESPIEKPTPIFQSPRNLGLWENVATGTERHLAKNRLRTAECDSRCADGTCWRLIRKWYLEYTSNWNNLHYCPPGVSVPLPKQEEWSAYFVPKALAQCDDYCLQCVYTSLISKSPCQVVATYMNIRDETSDPGCCAAYFELPD